MSDAYLCNDKHHVRGGSPVAATVCLGNLQSPENVINRVFATDELGKVVLHQGFHLSSLLTDRFLQILLPSPQIREGCVLYPRQLDYHRLVL